MSTPSARTGGSLDAWFKISARGSSVRQEIVAGLTTFLAMVYSVIVVPGMLGKAGFPPAAVFVSTCLVAGVGSLVMGLWANLPLAIGCAISLTAFTAFSLVLGQHISIPVALGAVFLMGVLFTIISATGIRSWILRNLPQGVAHGTGIGIGLFLLLIAANGVGLVIKNPLDGLPVALGHFNSFPVIMSLVGLAVIIGLEKMKVPGGILLTIIGISIVGLIFDPSVHFSGIFANTVSNKWTERLARAATIEMGGSALLAFYSMSGATAKKAVVRGTLDLCAKLGETLRQARAGHRDPVTAIVDELGAEVIFHGRVKDIERRTVGGFARGKARFEGVEEWKGHDFRLDFQNEFLMAERDGEIIVTTPDLITLLEAESGNPVTADALRYGLRLKALALPCNPLWRTPAGIELVGPRYFGYDVDYRPLGAS